jgi:hypothetical protein
VLDQSDVKQQLAMRGGYARPMAPSEVIAFVHSQQQIWNPILQKLGENP